MFVDNSTGSMSRLSLIGEILRSQAANESFPGRCHGFSKPAPYAPAACSGGSQRCLGTVSCIFPAVRSLHSATLAQQSAYEMVEIWVISSGSEHFALHLAWHLVRLPLQPHSDDDDSSSRFSCHGSSVLTLTSCTYILAS